MKHTTVIDIGSSKVMCVTAGSGGDGAFVVKGIGIRRYNGYRLGSMPTIGALSAAIEGAVNDAVESSGIRPKNVCVGIPAPFTKTVVASCEIEIATRSVCVTKRDIEHLLESSCEPSAPNGYELMHSTPFGFTLDGMPVADSPIGLSADKLGAHVAHVFVKAEFRRMVSDVMRSLGMVADPFVSSTMACAVFTIPFEQRKSGALLLDCGGSHCDVAFIFEDALIFSESIGIGSEHITNDLAMALRLPREQAEQLKRSYDYGLESSEGYERVLAPNEGIVLVERKDIKLIVEARTDEICQMLFEVICDAAPGLSFETPVYMTGSGITLIRGGVEYLSAGIGRDIRVNPPGTSHNDISFASAFGLAYFMLYGSGARVRQGGARMNIIKEIFTS